MGSSGATGASTPFGGSNPAYGSAMPAYGSNYGTYGSNPYGMGGGASTSPSALAASYGASSDGAR